MKIFFIFFFIFFSNSYAEEITFLCKISEELENGKLAKKKLYEELSQPRETNTTFLYGDSQNQMEQINAINAHRARLHSEVGCLSCGYLNFDLAVYDCSGNSGGRSAN